MKSDPQVFAGELGSQEGNSFAAGQNGYQLKSAREGERVNFRLRPVILKKKSNPRLTIFDDSSMSRNNRDQEVSCKAMDIFSLIQYIAACLSVCLPACLLILSALFLIKRMLTEWKKQSALIL